jgi:hypothetical protein
MNCRDLGKKVLEGRISMSDALEYHDGGCMCGAVRYRVLGAPTYAGICHCNDCRRATGGAYVPWFGSAPGDLEVTNGEITEHESSPGIWRGFCGVCGSSLTFRGQGWKDIAITIASLDAPNLIVPESNVYLRERLHWVRFNEEMRNYDEFPK